MPDSDVRNLQTGDALITSADRHAYCASSDLAKVQHLIDPSNHPEVARHLALAKENLEKFKENLKACANAIQNDIRAHPDQILWYRVMGDPNYYSPSSRHALSPAEIQRLLALLPPLLRNTCPATLSDGKACYINRCTLARLCCTKFNTGTCRQGEKCPEVHGVQMICRLGKGCNACLGPTKIFGERQKKSEHAKYIHPGDKDWQLYAMVIFLTDYHREGVYGMSDCKCPGKASPSSKKWCIC